MTSSEESSSMKTTNFLDIGIAHQKIIRDEKAITDTNNLFGAYWDDLDLSLKNAIVKPIDINSTKTMVEEYEWLGCMPAVVWYC